MRLLYGWICHRRPLSPELVRSQFLLALYTGHDKGRFTVVLAGMAHGRKLKLFLVFGGVQPVPEFKNTHGVVVAMIIWIDE